MKNLCLALSASLLFIVIRAAGQIPDATPLPRVQALPLPPPYPAGVPLNYIRSWQPQRAIKDAAVLTVDEKEPFSTRYFDGLGRAMQTVERGKSPARGDVVAPVVPEVPGRGGLDYLPYTATASGGRFRRDAFGEQSLFWSAMQPQEQVFYGSKAYDPSPGKSLRKVLAPGNSWQGSGRGQSYHYHAQTQLDEVVRWTVGPGAGSPPVFSGFYAPGALQKEISVDENGRQLVTCKDGEGRMILRKVPLSGAEAKGHNGFACTYFVYDEAGRLRWILPPKMVELLAGSGWKVHPDQAAQLCFRYGYDARGRVILRKTPGAGEEELLYDCRDRLVLKRNGNLRAEGRHWMATVYDALNRPVATGLYTSTLTDAALRDWLGKNGTLPPGNLDTFTRTFYDDYRFPGARAYQPGEALKAQAPGAQAGDPQPVADLAKGKVTGMRVRVLGTGAWLTTTFRYDRKMRLCQQTGELHTGGSETITWQYDFSGKPLVVRHLLAHPRNKTLHCVQTQNTYDHAGRMLATQLRLNDQPAWQRNTAALEYGPSGELARKTFFRGDGRPLESLCYTYNVRGWLTGINAGWLKTAGAEPHFFGQSLHYDHGFTVKNFNGDISGVRWKGFSTPQTRAHGYRYDASGRLLAADYSHWEKGAWRKEGADFSMAAGDGAHASLAYDANGNIRRLRHWGARGVQHNVLLDDLRYQYDLPAAGKFGNQLLGVTDLVRSAPPAAQDFSDDTAASLADYAYDANGNLLRDGNKGITHIRWNVLDLPEEITMQGKGSVLYRYDALGNKLSHTVIRRGSGKPDTVKTDYVSGAVYRNDTLQYMLHNEGRVRPVAGGFAWDYFVRDHLGNVRMVLTDERLATVYQATMEPPRAALESRLFSQVEAVRSALPAGYPRGLGVVNTAVARLNGKDPRRRVGPGLVLRVMAGDTLQAGVKAYYTPLPAVNPSAATPLQDMAAAALAAFAGTGAPLPGKGNGGEGASPFADNVTAAGWGRLRQREPNAPAAARPRAYLNFLLFDEQLNLVEENSWVKQAGAAPGSLQAIGGHTTVMKRSGYLYVFLSNESPYDVYFDDLTVSMRHGPVLEENHYYPFGLLMPGISVRAMCRPFNNVLYNGKEFQQNAENGVVDQEWYDYGARMYDPQTGRWFSPDKLADQYESVSPYAYAVNDPVNSIDPDGNLIIFVNGFMIHQWMAQDHRLTVRTAQRSMVDRGTWLTSFVERPNPNFRPYPGERTFMENAPTYLGKPFYYWSKIDDAFMQAHNDENARYISASADNASQASERFADGAMAGRRLIRKLDSRKIPLAADETIKVVGHSQGAAFAAGLVSVLSKHAKYSARLEIAYYIAPHQSGDFRHPPRVRSYQWSTFNDWVTDGWNLIHLFNGGSSNHTIDGIPLTSHKQRPPWTKGMGGHYVETYLDDIIAYFREKGITVNVY